MEEVRGVVFEQRSKTQKRATVRIERLRAVVSTIMKGILKDKTKLKINYAMKNQFMLQCTRAM